MPSCSGLTVSIASLYTGCSLDEEQHDHDTHNARGKVESFIRPPAREPYYITCLNRNRFGSSSIVLEIIVDGNSVGTFPVCFGPVSPVGPQDAGLRFREYTDLETSTGRIEVVAKRMDFPSRPALDGMREGNKKTSQPEDVVHLIPFAWFVFHYQIAEPSMHPLDNMHKQDIQESHDAGALRPRIKTKSQSPLAGLVDDLAAFKGQMDALDANICELDIRISRLAVVNRRLLAHELLNWKG